MTSDRGARKPDDRAKDGGTRDRREGRGKVGVVRSEA